MDTRRITRSRNDRMLAGVAGGLAAMFGVDPLIVRLAFVLLAALNGFGLILYIVLWLLVPNEDSMSDARGNVQESVQEMQEAVVQFVDRLRGAFQR
jgi:phage shock protein C